MIKIRTFFDTEEELEWCHLIDKITKEEINSLSEKEKYDILYEMFFAKMVNKYRGVQPKYIEHLRKSNK